MDFKSKLKNLTDSAKELAGKATDAAKNSISQAQSAYEEGKEKRLLAKQPQEGGLKRYEVTYRGGHPDYPMSKAINKYPYIILDVMPDRLSFLPQDLSREWFKGFELPYSSIISIEIVERTMSFTESMLGSGSSNSDLRQKNVLEIRYIDNSGDEFVMRNEMLTGTSVMGQARVCQEMMDLLRTNKILKLFRGAQTEHNNSSAQQDDIVLHLKKYKELLDSNVITQEEFDAKKKQLLGL